MGERDGLICKLTGEGLAQVKAREIGLWHGTHVFHCFGGERPACDFHIIPIVPDMTAPQTIDQDVVKLLGLGPRPMGGPGPMGEGTNGLGSKI